MALNLVEKNLTFINWKNKEKKSKSRISKTLFRRIGAIFTLLKNTDDWMAISFVANIININNTDLDRLTEIIALIQDQSRIDIQTVGDYCYLRLDSNNPNNEREK